MIDLHRKFTIKQACWNEVEECQAICKCMGNLIFRSNFYQSGNAQVEQVATLQCGSASVLQT